MRANQQGSALLVGLVILTAITLSALVGMQRSTVQIRMVSNLQHQQELDSVAQGTLEVLWYGMRGDRAVRYSVLNQVQTAETAAISGGAAEGSARVNPFDAHDELTAPSFSYKSLSSSTAPVNQARLIPSPPGSERFLRGKPGCNSSCSVMKVAASTLVTGRNGNATASQEVGLIKISPIGR